MIYDFSNEQQPYLLNQFKDDFLRFYFLKGDRIHAIP
jgi:hypothetical protein